MPVAVVVETIGLREEIGADMAGAVSFAGRSRRHSCYTLGAAASATAPGVSLQRYRYTVSSAERPMRFGGQPV